MISKTKKYFSFFGMMATAVDIKINALFSVIDQLLQLIVNIQKQTQHVVLQPVQLKNKIRK